MKKKLRLAILGVGNCASSLVQGLTFYKDITEKDERVPGLMHNVLGGYAIQDIEVVLGIDIDGRKVGRDVSEAIFAQPNNTLVFEPNVPLLGAPVIRGMRHDGVGKYCEPLIPIAPGETADITQALRDHHVDVVVNYLPVGSEMATKWYVEQILAAECALVNCIPVFIASSPYWQKRFSQASVPVLGDDIKSQVGATIVHRTLATLFADRGVRVDRTYQLNFGGNTDFLNMLERERLESKKVSKTGAVTSMLPYPVPEENVHVGPSDHIPFLRDRKFCEIRIEGTTFGNVPLLVTAHLEVWDSPNSAGVVIDAIRCAKLALDRGLSGAITGPSSYFFKTPPQQFRDSECRLAVENFIQDNA
jgi:myo-inositol-1-phosphate synthase